MEGPSPDELQEAGSGHLPKYEPGGTLAWIVNKDINRGVSVRVGTDRAVYVLGQGLMLTVRYVQT